MYLVSTHLTCIVFLPRSFRCHYCNLQDDNLYEANSTVVTEQNKGSDYKLNFFLQVRDM